MTAEPLKRINGNGAELITTEIDGGEITEG